MSKNLSVKSSPSCSGWGELNFLLTFRGVSQLQGRAGKILIKSVHLGLSNSTILAQVSQPHKNRHTYCDFVIHCLGIFATTLSIFFIESTKGYPVRFTRVFTHFWGLQSTPGCNSKLSNMVFS